MKDMKMKQIIKIDRSTIRKNPDAGKRSHIVPGRSIMIISGKFSYNNKDIDDIEILYKKLGQKEYLLQNIDFSLGIFNNVGTFSILVNPNGFDNRSYFLIIQDLYRIFDSLKYTINTQSISYELKRENQILYTVTPEPNYLYEYIPTNIQCDYCNRVFSYKELKRDLYRNDYNYEEFWSNNICPLCDEPNCAEIEYEKL
jgi:hypothetical protein